MRRTEYRKVVAVGQFVAAIYLAGCGVGPTSTEHTDERGSRHSSDDCAKLVDDAEFRNWDGDLALTAVVDYATVKAQVFTPSCTTSCHAPGKTQANVDLSTYVGAKANISLSISETQSDSMPNGNLPKLTVDKKALLIAWLAGGLVETAPATPTPTATPVSGGSNPGGTTTPTPTTNGNSSDSAKKSPECM